MNFLGEKKVIVKLFRENEVTMKFFGKNEVTINFLEENEIMVKPLGIDEDPFPLAASINIVATDSRVMLNAKNVGRF